MELGEHFLTFFLTVQRNLFYSPETYPLFLLTSWMYFTFVYLPTAQIAFFHVLCCSTVDLRS